MNTAALRQLAVYAVILPLAVLIGWIISGDMTRTTFAVLAAIVFVLCLPLLLKWHYLVMVFSWNTYITIFFLPGQPGLWMLMVGINFGLAILNRIMQKRVAFFPAPSITITLLLLLAVVVITAKLRGGMGIQAFGDSTYGGKKYYFIFAAILGYFAFASRAIPKEQIRLYVGLFFLPGLISAGSTLIYLAGPAFYPLFLIFPVSFAAAQASTDLSPGTISRVVGFSAAAPAVIFYLFGVHGIGGVLKKWWRPLLIILALIAGALGGYRSTLVIVGLVLAILFVCEGLFRSPLFPLGLLLGGLGLAVLVPLAPNLPASIQRSLSFLPLKLDPIVRADAEGSIEWRVHIWQALVPDLPKYYFLGTGFALNPTQMYLTQEAMRRGLASGYEGALVTQDFHSGPLSVYVPFGGLGSLAFLAFLVASLRALYLNWRHGAEDVRVINRFLFAYFCARTIFYFFGFGSLYSDLYIFTGTVGLSVALNKGISRRTAPAPASTPFRRNLPLRPARPGVA